MNKNTSNKSHKGFKCMDCRKDTWNEYYMVYSRIWKKANSKLKDKLCINCIESRLGRKLKKGDFTTLPINKIKTTRSKKLKDRLEN